jgi:hypothetical protein
MESKLIVTSAKWAKCGNSKWFINDESIDEIRLCGLANSLHDWIKEAIIALRNKRLIMLYLSRGVNHSL